MRKEEIKDGAGSVLKEALFRHPSQRGKRSFPSGVLQLQQVAHFTNGLQSLKSKTKKATGNRRLILIRTQRDFICASQMEVGMF